MQVQVLDFSAHDSSRKQKDYRFRGESKERPLHKEIKGINNN